MYRSIIYDLSIYMLQLLFQCSVCTPTLRVLLLLFMSCCENFPKVSPRDDFFAVKVFAASILKYGLLTKAGWKADVIIHEEKYIGLCSGAAGGGVVGGGAF